MSAGFHVGVAESARQSDWDGIVACHRGYLVSTTWNYHKASMGSHKLEPDRFNKDRGLSVHATVSRRHTANVCLEIGRAHV